MRANGQPEITVFESLGDALGSLNLSNTLIVTSGTGLKNLNDPAGSIGILEVPTGEPKLADLLSLDVSNLKGIRRIVSIGGGSVIDFGKGVLAVAEFPELRSGLVGTTRPMHSIGSSRSTIEHVVIPTRAGSGSEASSSAIFLDDSRKVPIVGRALLPKSVFWVPSLLTRSFSSAIVGILDMMGHAVESLLSVQPNKEQDLAALSSVRTLMDFSEKRQLTDWDNLRLLSESFACGRCQDLRLVSVPHALAHNFSNGLPHGLLVGNFLSQFLSGLPSADQERFDYLGELFLENGLSQEKFQTILEALVSECNRELGISEFEKVEFSDARVAFSDPSSRLTSVRIGEHNFSDFNFKKPVKVV